MATVMKRRSLVNSGKRRRKMSPKQIAIFGTKAQKAALKSSRKRKRNYGTRVGRSWSSYSRKAAGKRVKKRRKNSGLFSRRKSKKAAKKMGISTKSFMHGFRGKEGKAARKRYRASKRRKNIGQIFSIGLAGLAGNPGRKRVTRKRRTSNNMARRRKRNSGRKSYARRRTRRAVAVTHRRRRRRATNSGTTRRRSYRRRRVMHHSRRRRNPGVGSAFSSGGSMLKSALGIIGGAVATRYTTQFVLQGKNTGWMGYLGNAVAALVLGWAAKKFLKSPQLGTMVTLGGFTGLALRLLTDLTPVGQYVNLQLSGVGKAGDIGIGMITDSVFTVPTVFQPGSMTQAQIPTQYSQAMSIAAASARGGAGGGMGSYRRRRVA